MAALRLSLHPLLPLRTMYCAIVMVDSVHYAQSASVYTGTVYSIHHGMCTGLKCSLCFKHPIPFMYFLYFLHCFEAGSSMIFLLCLYLRFQYIFFSSVLHYIRNCISERVLVFICSCVCVLYLCCCAICVVVYKFASALYIEGSAGWCLACGPTGRADLLIDKTDPFIRARHLPGTMLWWWSWWWWWWWRWWWWWWWWVMMVMINMIILIIIIHKGPSPSRHNAVIMISDADAGEDDDDSRHSWRWWWWWWWWYSLRWPGLETSQDLLLETEEVVCVWCWKGGKVGGWFASDDAQSGFSSGTVAWQKYTTGHNQEMWPKKRCICIAKRCILWIFGFTAQFKNIYVLILTDFRSLNRAPISSPHIKVLTNKLKTPFWWGWTSHEQGSFLTNIWFWGNPCSNM